MIKKLFSVLFVLLATTAMAQPGSSCLEPIPVNNGYKAYIEGPCVMWYSAGSFDLPMNVYFLPDAEGSTKAPVVLIDFTCDPGVYSDPKLAKVVSNASELGYALPLDFLLRKNGKAYELDIPKFYRDQLLECGIDYNVPTVAEVTFYESGWINLTPDTTFKNCLLNSPYITLGDTIDVAANDEQSVYVAQLPVWKSDSVRFVWEGEQPVQMYWANSNCDFTPTAASTYVYKTFEISKGTPLKMYSEETKAHIEASKDGGIYFVKFVAPTSGRLVLEKIPATPAAGDAIVLEYDKPETVTAAAATQLYAFSKTWKQATAFMASNKFEMQVSNSYLFDTSVANAFVYSYTSELQDAIQTVGFSSTEMANFASKAFDDYLYVRFVVSKTTAIVPRLWEVSECVDATTAIQPNVPLVISPDTKNNFYRLSYKDFSGYDMTIQWGGSTTMKAYIGDTCSFAASASNSHVLYNKTFNTAGKATIKADVVNSWESRVDEEGNLYVRFTPNKAHQVTFLTEKPAEEEPTKPDPVYSAFKATVCYGETYTWNDKTYDKSDYYTQNFVAVNGADSIVVLQLTVLPEHKPEVTEKTIEYGETYEWNGKTYTETTTDTVVLKDNNDCNYLAILRLTVNAPKPVHTSFSATVCYGETYTWNGQTYGETGNHTQSFVAVNGADSIVTLQLTVLPEHKPETTEATIEYGETYEWNGKTYTETTTDTVVLKDNNDCNYLAILRLTVNAPKPVHTSFSATVCYGETYTWNGQTYGETGNHTQSFVAVNGADSIVTLQLTVLPEHKPEVTEKTIEYGETYPWQGKTYTESTTDTVVLKDNNGCEYLAILKLTVNAPQPVYTSFADTVCYGETYTWNGYKYTETKEYTQTFKATNGADSIVTLKLTVLPEHKPEVTEKTIEYGETYTWHGKTYNASDKYTITLEDENGCEYQATLILTINPKPEVPCELSTIELKVGDQLVLNLDSAFTIYTIDYDAWLSTGATLVWTGEEPLHTFAAEQCEFAVAPYNKYVIEYFAIPAKGMVVIDSSILSSMAGRVDAGGYLYIRFLTEKEGVLEVK